MREIQLNKTVPWRTLVVAALAMNCGAVSAVDYVTLETIHISATRIYFDGDEKFSPSMSSTQELMVNFRYPSPEFVIVQSVISWSSVCTNPWISQQAKNTTSAADMTDRWLAAQEVFNSIQMRNLLSQYTKAYNNLSIIMNGTKYAGFRLSYADGVSELWAISPNHATSVVKLLDQPFPGSQKPGGATCNRG